MWSTLFINNGEKDIHKETEIDCESLKKNVLLNLYYAEMMKIKVKTTDILSIIEHDLWREYASKEGVFRNRVVVPLFETMRMMAILYKINLLKLKKEKGCVMYN